MDWLDAVETELSAYKKSSRKGVASWWNIRCRFIELQTLYCIHVYEVVFTDLEMHKCNPSCQPKCKVRTNLMNLCHALIWHSQFSHYQWDHNFSRLLFCVTQHAMQWLTFHAYFPLFPSLLRPYFQLNKRVPLCKVLCGKCQT